MSLTLEPKFDRRERILAFGPPGAGKSYAWQTILSATDESVHFYVIDTDGAWEPAATSDEFAPYAHRVTHYEPLDWREFLENVQEILGKINRRDWFVIDLADKAWDEAQEFYAEQKYGSDLDVIVEGGEDDVDPQSKWGIINSLYKPFARSLIRCPANVFACATEKELKKDNRGNYFRESRQHVRDFGALGVKPGGQKNLPYDLSTVLHIRKTGAGREIEMVKDRNREAKWNGQVVKKYGDSFAKTILLPIAGWMPVTKPKTEAKAEGE